MSMENAILELAAAIRELAGSGHRTTGMPAALAAPYGVVLPTEPAKNSKPNPGRAEFVSGDAELEQAVEKVEAAAKGESKAKAAARAATSVEEKTDEPAATLDYKADVYPKLVALAKAKGKPALVGLLKEFDAANGDALKAEQYSAVVARAAELAA